MKFSPRHRVRILIPLAVLLILAISISTLTAIQAPTLEIGLGGGYDGSVYITRDAHGRMVFRDNEVTSPTTLFKLYSPGAFHVEDLGTTGSLGTAPVSDGAGHLSMTPVITASGSGTTNTLPRFTSTRAVGNSQIKDDGTNVIVGTGSYSSIDGRLIISDPTNPGIALRGAGGSAPGVVALNATGSFASPAAANNGMPLFTFGAGGYNGAAWVYNKAVMQLLTAEAWSATANGTYMVFSTTPNGTTSRQVRMLIGNDGNVGIGTTTPRRRLDALDASNPQLRLSQADNSKFTDLQTDSNGYLTVAPSGARATLNGTLQVGNTTPAAYNRIGTAATARSLASASDLSISGKLETQGDLYAEGAIWRAGQRLTSSVNLLDNPDFTIWQRNTTMDAAAGGNVGGTLTYPVPGTLSLGADRWQASRAQTSTSATISRATTPGTLTTADYALKVQASAGSPVRTYIHQTLTRSATRALRGRYVTFAISSYLNGTAGGTIALYKTISGTPTELAHYTFASTSSDWDRVAISAQIPADAECLIVSIQPELSTSGTTTAYFANATLLEGRYVATNERVTDPTTSSVPPTPRDPSADLAACQRFYERGSLIFNVYAADTSSHTYNEYVAYETAKNASPTITLSNNAIGLMSSATITTIERPTYAAGATFPSGFIYHVDGTALGASNIAIAADWIATCPDPI